MRKTFEVKMLKKNFFFFIALSTWLIIHKMNAENFVLSEPAKFSALAAMSEENKSDKKVAEAFNFAKKNPNLTSSVIKFTKIEDQFNKYVARNANRR